MLIYAFVDPSQEITFVSVIHLRYEMLVDYIVVISISFKGSNFLLTKSLQPLILHLSDPLLAMIVPFLVVGLFVGSIIMCDNVVLLILMLWS